MNQQIEKLVLDTVQEIYKKQHEILSLRARLVKIENDVTYLEHTSVFNISNYQKFLPPRYFKF